MNYILKNFIKNNHGIALIITILLMNLILFLSLYFLSFSLTENRIARSQTLGTKTFYLAEAGVAEIVWKLKNDNTYKTNFETDPDWTANFTRDNPFGANSGSYTVTIANSEKAHADITVESSINVGNGSMSKRVVKTYVYRAIGLNPIGENGIFADNNIKINGSNVNIYNGSAHADNKFEVKGGSNLNVDNNIEAVDEYSETGGSTVTVGGTITDKNNPPVPAEIVMPSLDFNSSDPNSYKNRADAAYTEEEFEDLIENDENIILNGPITYVDGKIEFPRNINLTINGLLVAKEDIEFCPEKSNTSASSTQCASDHIHHYFDWGIEFATYFDIIFHGSGGNVTKRINFQDYVSGGKFEIEYITQNVDGVEQEIKKIHTHDMDPSNTTLCIHTEGSKLNKTFDIEIDGIPITFYDSNVYSNTYPGVTCIDKGGSQSGVGECTITVNYASGTPSGIFSGENIEFKKYIKTIDVTGLIYAVDEVEIEKIKDLPASFSVTGGIVGRKIDISSSWQPINITFNNAIISDALETSIYSPIITIEHWEEEY